ncbi:MAG: hypothetical protein H6655_12495 [Ardenticatenaceae bacterium]|nr:hypothetical protein [Ardenticatenaceae bacterium]
MENSQIEGLDPALREARAKVLARVYTYILSPEWGEPDEPIILGTRQRRPSKRKTQGTD